MANELEWQSRIIKSVRRQGGYGRKWATQLTVGVPDLVLSFQGIGPFFMEVKLLRNCVHDFDRKIGLQPKQMHELAMLNKAGAEAFVGVVVEWKAKLHPPTLFAVPWQTERLQGADYDGIVPQVNWTGPHTLFNISGLYQEYKVRRMR